jgi:methylenetetrahydrofolate reductase (NADPH)
MKHHIDNRIYHVEIPTPKQNTEDLDGDLQKFAEKYEKVMEAGYVACITDNPMGHLSFQATEIIPELGLTMKPEQLMIHLNTFHTKEHMDQILKTADDIGVKYLLVISGDGSERLPKLAPEAIGLNVNAVTAVELLNYIEKTHPGRFNCGVAFNPYEPQDHELDKMSRKMDAGAEFIITQPVLGRDSRVDSLKQFGVPVVIDAWMSKKLHLLSECIGYTIPENTPYDPISNLKELHRIYPDCGFYLALLGFKTQFPLLKETWITGHSRVMETRQQTNPVSNDLQLVCA